jgi:hypothetical protein
MKTRWQPNLASKTTESLFPTSSDNTSSKPVDRKSYQDDEDEKTAEVDASYSESLTTEAGLSTDKTINTDNVSDKLIYDDESLKENSSDSKLLSPRAGAINSRSKFKNPNYQKPQTGKKKLSEEAPK